MLAHAFSYIHSHHSMHAIDGCPKGGTIFGVDLTRRGMCSTAIEPEHHEIYAGIYEEAFLGGWTDSRACVVALDHPRSDFPIPFR